MKEGLKYFLKRSDGIYSNFYDKPEEILDLCAESGVLGELYATWVAPQLYARITASVEYEEAADTEAVSEGGEEPKQNGKKGPVRKKARRTKGAVSADTSGSA